jgi:ubiquinone/menaquinone biosynthesis C-methylase UbiE
MIQLTFTRRPDFFDEYGQPCFNVNQDKGLSERQNNDLLNSALADGYTAKVAEALKNWIKSEVTSANPGTKVDLLEIGGGGGSFFECVKDTVRTYINVDPGRLLLNEEERQRLADPKFQTIRCSAEEIPLENEIVDMVISIASLDHVPDYRNGLREIARVLRKDGKFILTLNNRRSWWKSLLSGTDFLKRREELIARDHYFQWSFAECKSNLSEYFDITSAASVTFFPFVPKLWRLALPVSDVLGKAFARAYGANILAICRKR